MDELAIIINCKANNAQGAQDYLIAFQEAEIPYQLYEIPPAQLAATVRNCKAKHSLLLVGGGDGTIRTAAQECIHSSTVLGVVALGTLNHFAKELALPVMPAELVAAIKKRRTMTIDLAEVNGQVFVNNSSVGFYPKFAQHRDFYTKKYNKWLSYIPGFIQSLKKHPVFSLHIKSIGLDLKLHTSFVMISNNVYSYEFPVSIKRNSFNESLLGLYYFKHGKLGLIKLFRTLFKNMENFEVNQSSDPIEIHFTTPQTIMISVDGDTIKTDTPLVYKCLPQSLTILTSPS